MTSLRFHTGMTNKALIGSAHLVAPSRSGLAS
jgi:hypothetical protein